MQTLSLSLQGYSASTLVCTVGDLGKTKPRDLRKESHLRPAPCMRQGCCQAANWKRARHSRRATKTCRNEDKQRQADTIGSRALCVPPHGCCVLSASRLQVHSHRCPFAGRRMHTHWLHVYQCSQTRLKAYRCKHAGAHRPGSRCTGALTQGMQEAPGATMQVPAGQAPGANLQVPTTDQAPGALVPAGSAPDIYVLSVWAPGPCIRTPRQ